MARFTQIAYTQRVDLIYDYLRGRQLFSRSEFAGQYTEPVLLFRRLKHLGQDEMQGQTMNGRGLLRVHELLHKHNLEILTDTHQVRVLRLSGAHVYRVGRSREVEMVLAHTSVSKYHAQIVVKEGLATLTDLHSKNGTRLNDQPIESGGHKQLKSGDEIAFGDVVVRYLEPSELYDELSQMTRARAPVPS